jgi:histidine triad (HIT) family protein
MPSIFTRIVNGEIPCFKVAESEEFLAFLDISPLVKGHVLVIPKKEIDYIFDIESDLHQRLWDFAQKVSHGIKKVIPCKRIGVAVIGIEVPHAHIHLIPINKVSDMNFAMPKQNFPESVMKETAQLITSEIIL